MLRTANGPAPGSQDLAVSPDAQRPGSLRYFGLLALVLAGYAFGGRTFAHLGFPPLYIGEILLLGGLIAIARRRSWAPALGTGPMVLLQMMMLWGLVRTVPYVSRDGVSAIRDGAVWGYALFAVVLAILIGTNERRIEHLFEMYGRFARVFIFIGPALCVLGRLVEHVAPVLPGTSVPLLSSKPGDGLVHLAGVAAAWGSGLLAGGNWLQVVALVAGALALGALNRGGLVALLAVMAALALARPSSRVLWRWIAALTFLAIAFVLSDVRLELPGSHREVSVEQLRLAIHSAFSSTDVSQMEGTKQWRLAWWRAIVEYTVFGEYFWQGKGFGVNLADEDGFQVFSDGTLRSPHNAHLTMLARGGVPGALLWFLVHASWFWVMFRNRLRAVRIGAAVWASRFFWLMLAAIAFLINASFDVFLEGPVGAVWFWCIWGVGIGCARTFGLLAREQRFRREVQ